VGMVEDGFGSVSDINKDERVAILVTLGVNKLGASGGGIITGYFYAADLYSRNSSNPTSNEMEIVYILSPDPKGQYGTTISKSFAMNNLMPAVVPHEVQHAISYNNHVFVNGGSSEQSWLNEAMSHFSEDYTGHGNENPSRFEIFLADTMYTPLAPSSSPDLGERGAGYSFLRFLYERTGKSDEFLKTLINTNLRGKDNLESAIGNEDSDFDEWSEFMRRWAIALAMTDRGISTTDQYQFDPRTLNPGTGIWEGICLICNAEDNRGTIVNGPYIEELSKGTEFLSLSGTSTAFYSIPDPMENITITGSSSAGLQGVLIRTN